ncbi:NAD-dependent 4,6-dehydratase LegB [Tumidithrix elongata RA019]|uniref:NAD-dependent 4,6-dehydratase LegB n=1 Tax=Tumidithrix elongata BACA0141 TaxID=2716417 RepID=A0AAW9PWZ6_9CYAN|nr:NAD-dependent 4,6-dehydratase LegB [Tumidithrix elongata RA019]
MELKHRQVLVTGSDGFIGSHLVERLLQEECKIRAFVYYNSFNSWGWLDSLTEKQLQSIEIFAGDIRDPNGVETAMKGCEVVFHLAALIAIPFSYHSPDSYVDTNIKGTLNILQSAKKLQIDKILITSTSEVYGTAKYVPIDENHPFQGQSPYSATKIGADRLAESFYRSFNLPVTIVRPFNTYGPRQSARAVIPTIITQLLTGSTEINLGSLSPTRDFNYVKDTTNAFIELAKSDKTVGEEINIATGIEISIGELANELIAQLNPQAQIICEDSRLRPDKSEVNRLLGCNKKILSLTNWKPQYNLSQGIAETIEWFRIPSNLAKYKAGIYNL